MMRLQFIILLCLCQYPVVPDDPDVGELELVEAVDLHLVRLELDVEEGGLLLRVDALA